MCHEKIPTYSEKRFPLRDLNRVLLPLEADSLATRQLSSPVHVGQNYISFSLPAHSNNHVVYVTLGVVTFRIFLRYLFATDLRTQIRTEKCRLDYGFKL
jgi:hypothetical protein